MSGDLPKFNPFIPECSANDIGRRIVRRNLTSHVHFGWDAIGVITAYHRPKENLEGDGGVTVENEDEITTNVVKLHESGAADTWDVLYGNRDTAQINTVKFIEGMQTHQKVKESEDLMTDLSISSSMMLESSCPPFFESYVPTAVPSPDGNNEMRCPDSDPEDNTNQDDIDPICTFDADVIQCHVCSSGSNEESMLLCDKCDIGYHIGCLNPPLDRIPEGDWFCDICINIESLQCKICSKKFKSEFGYLYHSRRKICVDSVKKVVSKKTRKSLPKSNKSVKVSNSVSQAVDDFPQVINEGSGTIDTTCSLCGSGENEENMLLCDKCDAGFHMTCLDPPLDTLPEGNWYCTTCVDKSLFNCKLCSKSFRTMNGYKYHINNKVCVKSEVVNTVSDDESETQRKDDDSVASVASVKKKLNKRKRKSPTDKSICTVCGEKVEIISSVNDTIDSAESPSSVTCKSCKGNFHTSCLGEEIAISDVLAWSCEPCLNQLTCQNCSKKFQSIAGCTYHVSNKVCFSKPANRSQICSMCNEEDQSLLLLTCHSCDVNCHDKCRNDIDPSAPVFSSTKYDRKIWYCQVCAADKDVVNFKCDDCGKCFKSKTGWKYHLKNICGEENVKNVPSDSETQGISEMLSRQKKRAKPVKSYAENIDDDDYTDRVKDPMNEEYSSDEDVKKRSRSSVNERVNNFPMEKSINQTYHERITVRYLSMSANPMAVDYDSRFEVINLSEWIDKLKLISNSIDNEVVMDSRKHLDIPNVVMTVTTSSNASTVLYPFRAVRRCQPQRNKSPFTLNDWFVSAGGPVWALDCKTDTRSESSSPGDTYIAIGLSRIGWERKGDNIFNRNPDKVKELGQQYEYDVGCDYKQLVNRKSTNPSVLEIWKYSQGGDESSLNLEYLIGFASRGPIWQARWSSICFSDVGVVGMIAIVFGDGTCAVMLVHAENIINKLQSVPRDISDADPMKYCRNIPLAEGEGMLLWELSCRNERVMSCSWNVHDSWQIACGMSDGSVCIWQLSSSQLKGNAELLRPIPTRHLIDRSMHQSSSRASIRSIEYCPYDRDVIVSGGYDTMVKFWDINEFNRPIKTVTVTGFGWIYDAQWDPNGRGIYVGGSDKPVVYFHTFGQDSLFRHQLYEHTISHSGIWKIHVVNDASDPLLVSTSSDGSVRLGLPNILAKTKNKQKLEVHELLQILSVNETEQDADVRKDDSDVDISRRRYQEVLVQVSMDQRSSTKSADESILPCSPAIAMHVVNSFISLEASNVRHTMIAYGGALGLVRIHKV